MDLFLMSIICIVGLLVYMLRRHQGAKNDNEPPMFHGAIPLLGHVHKLLGNTSDLYFTMKAAYNISRRKNGVFSYYMFTHVGYMISDPDDALTVLNKTLDKSDYYSFASPWVGDGLLTGKGSIWKVHRKVMNPAFSQHMLDGYLEVFNYQGRKIVDILKSVDGIPFNPWNMFRDQAFEAICKTLLGIDYSKQPEMITEMAEASEDLLNVFADRFASLIHNDWLYSFTNMKRRQDVLVKKLTDMTNGIIKDRSEQLRNDPQCDDESCGKKFKTLLTLLLEANIHEGKLSHREIREELDTMIVAGHETTFTTIMYFLVFLGSYPDIQERCYKEVMEVLGEDKDVDKYDISKLVYLEACIKESLRVQPIVPMIARQLTENVKLKNYTLSAGRTCVVSLWALNRHRIWGPNSYEFNPDRWLDLEKLPTHPLAFASFGGGRRNCIGKTYAMMVVKTKLAHIIRNYEVVADRSKNKFKMGAALKPKDPIYIVFNSRQKN